MTAHPSELEPWIDRQIRRSATHIRLKVGSPRSLKVVGTIDIYEDEKPRPTAEVVAELLEDLAGNGWPDQHESWGVDAMSESGTVLKSTQGTDKAAGKSGSGGKSEEARANRSDFEVLVDGFKEMAFGYKDLANSLSVRLIEADKQRYEAQQVAMATEKERTEAEMAAALEAAADLAEAGGEGYEATGIQALEKLADRLNKPTKTLTKKDLIKLARENPDLTADLMSDQEFLDALERAADHKERKNPPKDEGDQESKAA